MRSAGQRGLASGRHGDAVDLDLGDRHLRPFIYYAPIVPHRQCHFIVLDVLGTECEMLRDGLPRIGGGYKTVAVGVVRPIAVARLYSGNADVAARRINGIQTIGDIHCGFGIHIFLWDRDFGRRIEAGYPGRDRCVAQGDCLLAGIAELGHRAALRIESPFRGGSGLHRQKRNVVGDLQRYRGAGIARGIAHPVLPALHHGQGSINH